MTRSKVRLAYIKNDVARKSCYKKRKLGLIKKVTELSIICGVPACAVIYGEYDPIPEVWPSPQEAAEIFDRFNMLPNMEKTKKMVTQESFMRQSIKKAREQFIHLQKENRRKDVERLIYQCMNVLNSLKLFDMYKDASYLKYLVDQARRDVKLRIDELMNEKNQQLHVNPTFVSAQAVVPCAHVEALEHNEWSNMVDDYIRDGVHDLYLNLSFGHGWEYDGEVLPDPHHPNSY